MKRKTKATEVEEIEYYILCKECGDELITCDECEGEIADGESIICESFRGQPSRKHYHLKCKGETK